MSSRHELRHARCVLSINSLTMDVHGITFHLCQGVIGMIKGLYWMDADEQVFDSIYRTLAMSGEYENKEYLIEDQVHEIMDNPQIYPEYFN